MPEEWEKVFKKNLIGRAEALGDELRASDPDAGERGNLFFGMLTGPITYCPECWVRYGRATTLHKKRWLASCDEHDYPMPAP